MLLKDVLLIWYSVNNTTDQINNWSQKLTYSFQNVLFYGSDSETITKNLKNHLSMFSGRKTLIELHLKYWKILQLSPYNFRSLSWQNCQRIRFIYTRLLSGRVLSPIRQGHIFFSKIETVPPWGQLLIPYFKSNIK